MSMPATSATPSAAQIASFVRMEKSKPDIDQGHLRRLQDWGRWLIRGKILPIAVVGMHENTRLLAAKLLSQFHLGALQGSAPDRGQVFAGTIDVKRQHRQCRAIGVGFSAAAPLRRPLQRCGNFPGIPTGKHAAAEVESVAFTGHVRRPAAVRDAVRLATDGFAADGFTLPGFSRR
jgi:hypothetical protein